MCFDIISEINEQRQSDNKPLLSKGVRSLNINGRRFRDNEINIKICNVYETVSCDLNWVFQEIKDPWKRAKKHMELFNTIFGEKSIDQVRFDHFFNYTHICDVYKWLNRAYQLLRIDGKFIATFVDLLALFSQAVEADQDTISFDDQVEKLQRIERQVFTTSDSTGMYYHRTILTERRIKEYMKRSFFNNVEIERSFHEVMGCTIYEVKAVKDSDKQIILAPDGTLREVKS